MTIDLRWLGAALPFVLPFAIAGMVFGVFAISGVEMSVQDRQLTAVLSVFFGTLGGVICAAILIANGPIYRKLW